SVVPGTARRRPSGAHTPCIVIGITRSCRSRCRRSVWRSEFARKPADYAPLSTMGGPHRSGAALAVVGGVREGTLMAERFRPFTLLTAAVRFTLLASLIAVPALARGQDDRIDDPPEFMQGGGVALPRPISAAGLFAEPKLLTLAIDSTI